MLLYDLRTSIVYVQVIMRVLMRVLDQNLPRPSIHYLLTLHIVQAPPKLIFLVQPTSTLLNGTTKLKDHSVDNARNHQMLSQIDFFVSRIPDSQV
jgi:hypothetical protein